MLAYDLWEGHQCRQCGGDLTETTHVDNDPANMRGVGVYQAQPPAECYRCSALHKIQHDPMYAKDQRALIHRVKLVPRGTPSPFH